MKNIKLFSTKSDSYIADFKETAEALGIPLQVYVYENFSFKDSSLTYKGKKAFPAFSSHDSIIFRRCAYEKTRQYFWVRLLALLARDAGAYVMNEDYMVNFPLHSGKLFQAAYFASNNIPHVSTFLLSRKNENIEFPVIIKERYSALGKGTRVVHSLEEYHAVKKSHRIQSNFIVQPFKELARDIRVVIFNGEVVGSVSRTVKYHDDGHVGVKVQDEVALTKEEQLIIDKVLKTFSLDIAGIDLFTNQDGYTWLGEMNFFPNFSGFIKTTGKDLRESILHHLAEK